MEYKIKRFNCFHTVAIPPVRVVQQASVLTEILIAENLPRTWKRLRRNISPFLPHTLSYIRSSLWCVISPSFWISRTWVWACFHMFVCWICENTCCTVCCVYVGSRCSKHAGSLFFCLFLSPFFFLTICRFCTSRRHGPAVVPPAARLHRCLPTHTYTRGAKLSCSQHIHTAPVSLLRRSPHLHTR